MRLQGKTIGYFVAQEVEDLEFWVPVMRLREEGAQVVEVGHDAHVLALVPNGLVQQQGRRERR